MRRVQSVIALVGWTTASFIMGGGCNLWVEDSCDNLLTCPSVLPVECLPSPYDDPRVINDTCGVVYVSLSGDDAINDGTSAKPLRSLKRAIELATAPNQSRRIFVCAGTFSEAVSVPEGVELFGGLACDGGWSVPGSGAKSIVRTEDGSIPLRLLSGSSLSVDLTTRIEGFEIVGEADPSPGRSAIAVLVEDVRAIFERSTLIAGPGTSAEDEILPAGWKETTALDGKPGNVGCAIDVAAGAGGFNNKCAGQFPRGGNGGEGGWHEVSDLGGAKKYTPPKSGANAEVFGIDYGKGGAFFELGPDSPCPSDIKQNGRKGEKGLDGMGGQPEYGHELAGFLDIMSGFIGAPGTDAGKGTSGTGGGGGGGRTAQATCELDGEPLTTAIGPSGGGGGAGGCGGIGGKGGTPGGSSIALIAVGARLVTLSDVVIQVGDGGKGGDGAKGQSGQPGGAGGVPPADTGNGCPGGKGGIGGDGGRGGGGSGGHSIGVAYAHRAPERMNTTIHLGTAGKGGIVEGSQSPDDPTRGADGAVLETAQLPEWSEEALP